METCDIGVVGLGVMGRNLVANFASRGLRVVAHDRAADAVGRCLAEAPPGAAVHGVASVDSLVLHLARPRRILVMVEAGPAVDAVIEALAPRLEAGDIVIDGGNSLYTDTERREAALAARGLCFVGMGVSGGEEGARKGPSLMVGGTPAAWPRLQPVLEPIAARAGASGREACVAHVGPGGAGHFVKMVHNGIEYGDMQLICEAYALMQAAGMTAGEMSAAFAEWNAGELQSYLIEITARILAERDPATGLPMVDVIRDAAGQKGTGRWTIVQAAESGVAVGVIQAAVEARVLSSLKGLRTEASRALAGPPQRIDVPRGAWLAAVRDALLASKVVSYAQGFDLMRTVSARRGWALDLAAVARVWRGGCIIRARFLDRIAETFAGDAQPAHLMLAPFFAEVLGRSQTGWREVLAQAVRAGVPVPATSAALGYCDTLRSARVSANLLQAQRDFFGAHGFERTDRPEGEVHHARWPEVQD